MVELNRTQFKDVDPHQQALPGMEHLSHPWAGPLSRGYLLHYQGGKHEHELHAVEPGHIPGPRGDDPAADLSWAPGHWKRDGMSGYSPGEVVYVHNEASKTEARGKGLAGALFHSAHYFNFGQTTAPVHSPIRTEQGEHFASKVRPELRPDIHWSDKANRGHGAMLELATGQRTQKTEPKWNLPEEFHPYQQQQKDKDRAVATKMRGQRPVKGQGKLF